MSSLLEMRLFKLRPGTRDEFHRISDEGTIPMMRRYGINVLAYGPTLNDENGYLLLRSFADEEERVRLSQSLYDNDEWERNYEGPIMSMIESYHTAVIPAADSLVGQLAS
jgi:NIPSNAP